LATTGGFIAELKRRNVIRMAGLYLVTAWLLVQVGATLLPVFDAPPWTIKALVVTLAVAFLPSLALAWVFEFTPQGLQRDDQVPASQSIAPQNARRLDRAIIVVLTLAIGYFAFDKFVISPRREAALVAEASRNGAARAIKQEAERGKSIAVLPLVNASGDPAQQYFSDGLSESLIDTLSKFEGLRVVGRMSSFQFRGSKEGAQAIGAKLGAAYLLGGSVQRQGNTVRVRTEVVRTRDGVTQWAQAYDRPYQDLFALQDELTAAIAGVLKAHLLKQQAGKITGTGKRPPSGNLDAYAAFLQGNFEASIGTEQGMRRAIQKMQDAIALDANYAVAWANLSRYQVSLATFGINPAQTQKSYADADVASATALRLGPELADPHMARAWWLENAKLDWRGALAEYQKAFALAPADPWARFNAYGMQALMGQLDVPLQQIQIALADDPLEASWWNWYSGYLVAAGRLDEAESAIRKSIALQPHGSSWWTQLAVIEIRRGNADAALHAAKQESEGVWRDIALALALQAGKDHAAADAALQKLISQYADVAPYQIAQVQALRGDADATFLWLDRAYHARDSGMESILVDPMIMRYKHDPRLAVFSQKIGLPSPLESQTKGI
jgi:TolB-like protein/Flp pilus assembly protein TadD